MPYGAQRYLNDMHRQMGVMDRHLEGCEYLVDKHSIAGSMKGYVTMFVTVKAIAVSNLASNTSLNSTKRLCP